MNFTNTSILAGETVRLNISGFQNPLMTKPTGEIKIWVLDWDLFEINSSPPGVIITTVEPSQLSFYSVVQSNSNWVPTWIVNLTFTIMIDYFHESSSQLVITYPSQIQNPSSITCDQPKPSINITCAFDVSSWKITVDGLFSPFGLTGGSTVQVSINGLWNPSNTTNTSSFSLLTQTDSQFKIQKAESGMTISAQCNAPCETCSNQNGSQCLSCLQENNVFNKLQENTCVQECDDGWVLINLKCELCNQNCKTCVDVQSKCATCRDGTYLFTNFTCLEWCQDGFYGDVGSNECRPCKSPCTKCETSENQCTECSTGLFLYKT